MPTTQTPRFHPGLVYEAEAKLSASRKVASGQLECGVLRLRHPGSLIMERVFAEECRADLNYAEVGATASELPSGYRHDRLSTDLGTGREVFEQCAQHLDEWGLQRSVGFKIFPEDSHVAEGKTILLSLSLRPFVFVASARVVYTVDEDHRHGFAYGTLPTHPEKGEEYFGVAIDNADNVRFEITAFSRANALVARLGGPVTRRVQMSAMRKYGEAMKSFAASVD